MPDQTTEQKKAAPCPSFCGKAAGTAFAVAITIFLCVYLAATLPGKQSSWQTALPTPGMSEPEAVSALSRAYFLHEATVRPKLIEAGFVSVEDLESPRGGWYRSNEPESFQLTQALWKMRAFPDLHAHFLRVLTDRNKSKDDRIAEFFLLAGLLDNAASKLVDTKSRDRFSARDYENGSYDIDWFAYFSAAPRLPWWDAQANRARQSMRDPQKTDPEAIKRYAGNMALARKTLPSLLARITEDYATQKQLETKDKATLEAARNEPETDAPREKGSRKKRPQPTAWGGYHKVPYLDELAEASAKAFSIISQKRGEPAFLPLVEELLASPEGTLIQRFEAVRLLAQQPGLPASEYLFWQKHYSDLNSVSGCVGTSPTSYAYLIGCCDTFGEMTKAILKNQGTAILGTSTEGPGVTLTRTETFLSGENVSGNLYLLADMSHAMKEAPAYDLSRAVPIFRGHLFRYLKNQPLVLPLNPKNPEDAAVIAWYAAEGWKEGRTVLFTAIGTPEQVARHWASVHLLWWNNDDEKADDEPALAYLHPESGHFWLAVLPHLKGADVSRFLGPVTALWFGRENVDASGWVDEKYEARPEIAPSLAGRNGPLTSPILDRMRNAFPTKKEPDTAQGLAKGHGITLPTVLFGEAIREATGENFSLAYNIALAQHLAETFPDETTPPLDALAFVNATRPILEKGGIKSARDLTAASEYLWQFRGHPEIETRIRKILSSTELRPYERLRKVRRVLGLPEDKNNRGGC
ncbi:MAG: hypothetical protein DELT_00951 [Desulfovibrio sp.]